MIALDLAFTQSDLVLGALADRLAHSPMPCPLPERLEIPAEPAQVREFVSTIVAKPPLVFTRRLPVQAYTLEEARESTADAVRLLFPGMSVDFTTRPA